MIAFRNTLQVIVIKKIRDQCVYPRPIIQWIPSSISVAHTLTCRTSPYVGRINPSWAAEISAPTSATGFEIRGYDSRNYEQ